MVFLSDRFASVTLMMLVGLTTLSLALANAAPESYYPPDVVGQFNALTDRADALGWGIADSPDPSMCYHYQGVARSHGLGQPYLFVTRSGNQPPGVPCVQWCSDINLPCTQVGDGPGQLLVVKWPSRDGTGERLRSNRLVHNTESADSHPEPGDEVVTVIDFDGQNGWPSYGHPGGMQMIGNILAIPLEKPYEDDESINRILFVDVSIPENPIPLSSLEVTTTSDTTIGVVAVSRMSDGRYLLITTGKKGDFVRVYESNANQADGSTDLHDLGLTWTHKYNWSPDNDPVDPPCISLPPSQTLPNGYTWGWPEGGFTDYAHQSLTFVREGGPNGPLFLIGGRDSNAAPLLGQDRLDLYSVDWDGSQLRLGCVAQRHLHSTPSLDGALIFHNKLASFAAATGIYISPSGEMILYATEHDNDGPGATVKSGEWRHIDMVRPNSPTYNPGADAGGPYTVPEGSSITLEGSGTQPATKAWMQLWNDPDFSDRYVVIDYDDRHKDDFDEFEDLDDGFLASGYAREASSMSYYAPVGCTLEVTGYNLTLQNGVFTPIAAAKTLAGAGATVRLDDLDDVASEINGGDMDDAINKATFQSDCDTYYSAAIEVGWDFDQNGSYETPGAAAIFSALELDGPSVAPLTMRAQHPIDGRTATDAVDIVVINVPPELTSLVITDELGRPIAPGVRAGLMGLPLTAAATFVDAGRPDTHTASIAWGDGAISAQADLDSFSPATGGFVGSASDAHLYGAPGAYNIATTIIDDDGDQDTDVAPIEILALDDALQQVADNIEQWLDTLVDKDAIRALVDALRHIIGNGSGSAGNGTLNQLDADNLNAAMVQLREAVESLSDAEAATGLNFDEEQGTLSLVALSIASTAYEAAAAFANPTSASQTNRLNDAALAIEQGRNLLLSSAFEAGIEELRDAVQLTASILTGA